MVPPAARVIFGAWFVAFAAAISYDVAVFLGAENAVGRNTLGSNGNNHTDLFMSNGTYAVQSGNPVFTPLDSSADKGRGPAHSFGLEYINLGLLGTGRKLLLVNCGQSNTSLASQWLPPSGSAFLACQTLVNQSLSLGDGTSEIVAVVVLLGEAECASTSVTNAALYLQRLATGVRGWRGAQALTPFLTAPPIINFTDVILCPAFAEVISNAPFLTRRAAAAETRDLVTESVFYLDDASQITLGTRLAQALPVAQNRTVPLRIRDAVAGWTHYWTFDDGYNDSVSGLVITATDASDISSRLSSAATDGRAPTGQIYTQPADCVGALLGTLNVNFTIAFWHKVYNSVTATRYIMGCYPWQANSCSSMLSGYGTSSLRGEPAPGSLFGIGAYFETVIGADTWYFGAMSSRPAAASTITTVYQNGVTGWPDYDDPNSVRAAMTVELSIGQSQKDPGLYCDTDGKTDDVMIFNRYLSQRDVIALYLQTDPNVTIDFSVVAPTAAPTAAPSAAPTLTPSAAPTATPTAAPSAEPSAAPSAAPTAAPTATECPEGEGSNGTTGCAVCPPGRYSTLNETLNARTCQQCTMGWYTAESNLTACSRCNAGFFASATGSSVCDPCASGRFSPSNGASVCMTCDPGYFAADAEMTGCTECIAGRYANASEATSCPRCAAGYIAAAAASTTCTLCASGTFASDLGSSVCLACVNGYSGDARASCSCYYQLLTTNASAQVCETCDDGSFAEGPSSPPVCELCAVGRYGVVPWNNTCAVCAAEFYQPNTGATACLRCTGTVSADRSACQTAAPVLYLHDVAGWQVMAVFPTQLVTLGLTLRLNDTSNSTAARLCNDTAEWRSLVHFDLQRTDVHTADNFPRPVTLRFTSREANAPRIEWFGKERDLYLCDTVTHTWMPSRNHPCGLGAGGMSPPRVSAWVHLEAEVCHNTPFAVRERVGRQCSAFPRGCYDCVPDRWGCSCDQAEGAAPATAHATTAAVFVAMGLAVWLTVYHCEVHARIDGPVLEQWGSLDPTAPSRLLQAIAMAAYIACGVAFAIHVSTHTNMSWTWGLAIDNAEGVVARRTHALVLALWLVWLVVAALRMHILVRQEGRANKGLSSVRTLFTSLVPVVTDSALLLYIKLVPWGVIVQSGGLRSDAPRVDQQMWQSYVALAILSEALRVGVSVVRACALYRLSHSLKGALRLGTACVILTAWASSIFMGWAITRVACE